MNLPYDEHLKIELLSRIFDNKSESYKLFWFNAILEMMTKENKKQMSYDELVNHMLASAWYMVNEFHLNLGPSDAIEETVKYFYEISGLKSSEERKNIIEFLSDCTDKQLLKMKRRLILNVPYHILSPFLGEEKKKINWGNIHSMTSTFNSIKDCFYSFGEYEGLNTMIHIDDDWFEYFIHNQDVVKGWLDYHFIIYLQGRNPNVPGISNKINPPKDRDLDDIRKFYKEVMKVMDLTNVYGDEFEITSKNLSVDHFIPWSYVSHDELWNLCPTTKSINSSKSNNLPDKKYIEKLCEFEYEFYQTVLANKELKKKFVNIEKQYINDDSVKAKLYNEHITKDQFYSNLKEIISPVYQSAENCGFKAWEN